MMPPKGENGQGFVGHNEPSHPRMVDAELTSIEVAKLRAKGYTYQRISDELTKKGITISASGAHKSLKRGLKILREQLNEEAGEVLQIELGRLDDLLGPQYEVAMTGDPRAAEVCLKILDRRAKYLGLDNPGSWPTGADGNPQAPGLNLEAMDVAKLETLAALLKEAQGPADGE